MDNVINRDSTDGGGNNDSTDDGDNNDSTDDGDNNASHFGPACQQGIFSETKAVSTENKMNLISNFIAAIKSRTLFQSFHQSAFCVLPDVPSAPKNLVISEVTDESAQIEWSAPEKDGGSKITGYVIEKRDSGRQQWMRVGQTDAKTRSIKARNLLEGRPYSFRVMAENAEGLSEPLTLHKPITPMKPIGEYALHRMFFFFFLHLPIS